jgi:glycogen synthase
MAPAPAPISTARLALVPVSPELAAAVIAGDLSALTVGEGWPHEDTVDGLRMAAGEERAWLWFVTLEGVVIGDCGTHGEPDERGEVEVGYGVAGPYRGRGYGTEIVIGLSSWLLGQPGVRRVIARVAADNAPSQRALERAGFALEPPTARWPPTSSPDRFPFASMRVLVISWEYPPVIEGGLGRHVRKLSEQLVEQGVEVHVLTRGGAQLAAEEERHGVVVHRVPEPPFPKDISAFVRWVHAMNADMRALGAELMERLEFELVHSHDWLVAGAAERLARRARLPWLTTVHATEYGRHQGWVQNHPQSHIHAVERSMVRRADRVITCSQYMQRHVASVFGVKPQKVTVIPNGIDPRDLEPVVEDLAALRARYAAPDERLVLLVGRLVYEKGFHLALDALAPVIKRFGNVRFVVAGTGTAETELRHQAQRLGLMRHGSFSGWVGDDMLHSLYRVAEVVIVPSIYEPFGLVALEAMASGCVCVVADTGGLREVVPADRTVGLRFPSRDSAALREVLEQVLADDRARERVVAEAREHVLQFDWVEVARRTQGVYAALAGQPGLRPAPAG